MEYIKKEELIEGEIYKASNESLTFIMKATKDLYNVINIPSYNEFMKSGNFNGSYLTFINATSEEKHWLNCCITADKFITFEEAMKTFIPEYVEWIDNIGSGNLGYQTKDHFKKNKIFKTDVELPSHGFQTQNWIKHLEIYANNYKPSTKEAYDAQFVVKEPEFMLPEKWYILRTKENHKILNKWCNENKLIGEKSSYTDNTKKLIYSETPYNSWVEYKRFSNITDDSFTEINFEQFKKYVLKEETPVQDFMKLHDEIIMKDIPLRPRGSVLMDINIIDKEIIEPLPQFKVIETIETITKVENNEGNQFFIGDEVIGSKTKIKSKIISFKYNVDKTAILAITDKTSNIGIGINHLEHYIEPKVEETLLEKAKRLYPIGTIVKSVSFNDVRTIGTDIFKEINHEYSGKIIYADNGNISIYSEKENHWATIIK